MYVKLVFGLNSFQDMIGDYHTRQESVYLPPAQVRKFSWLTSGSDIGFVVWIRIRIRNANLDPDDEKTRENRFFC